jgi:hypothetical protein
MFMSLITPTLDPSIITGISIDGAPNQTSLQPQPTDSYLKKMGGNFQKVL